MRWFSLTVLCASACVGVEQPDGLTGDDAPDPVVDEVVEPEEERCPSGIICVDSMPYTDSNDTRRGDSVMDSYSCAPDVNESGPELVYRLTLDEPGVLFARVTDGEDVDVDVHLLQVLDEGGCVQRGHLGAGVLAEPGTWYIVVDSWVDDRGRVYDGQYELEVGHTTADMFEWEGLDPNVLGHALYAWDKAWFWGDIERSTMAVVDFTRPSNESRTWILDLATQDLLFELYTSHGQGSQDPDDITAVGEMSNTPQSNQSSFGVMRGSESYSGNFGYSMRIDGLEEGFNDNVRDRAIVLHRGDYASDEFVAENGYCGRSNGCLVYDPDVTDQIVDALKDGGMIFAWWPDEDWLANSEYLSGY